MDQKKLNSSFQKFEEPSVTKALNDHTVKIMDAKYEKADLNMGYYTIRLDPDSQKICTIILPWGKYSYLRLPMGICGSPDFFQEKMTGLMQSLDYIRCYIDGFLIISKDSYAAHLIKIREVLRRLLNADLRVNMAKPFFALPEIEYLGYILIREGIKPQPEKCTAILALKKDLRT